MIYDYVIVGSGLFGATFARLATDAGKKCLVLEQRKNIGGNVYTEEREGIQVHVYGPHIFHCNDVDIWHFVNRFATFNNFVASPKALNGDRMYSLPFNMNTFHEIWPEVKTPEEAKKKIESQTAHITTEPKNLEEQAIKLVGPEIYELLVKHYTRKQWQMDPKDLPAFIIKRLPVRFTYDNNYFNDRYQGIPIGGFGSMMEKMLEGIDVRTGCNYFDYTPETFEMIGNTIVFTGKIDEFFNYRFGELEYRTMKFEHETHDVENYQGCAVINDTGPDNPWTRITEHRHFDSTQRSNKTIVTKEIPDVWDKSKIPYYPINDDKNMNIYREYKKLADQKSNYIFGGRLSEYRYYDMHQIIGSAMKAFQRDQIL